jgi:LmbE family N-acetylglucosaminyl deacetylase
VRVVVIGAHPGDEAVGAASVLLRGHEAAVVHLTDGVPRAPRLRPGPPDRAVHARLRADEAREALAIAGVARIVRLGGAAQEVVHGLAPLARELAAVLSSLAPRIVVGHAYEGGHPDHDAAALATRAALALLERSEGAAPRLVEMAGAHLPGGLATHELVRGPRVVRHRLTPSEQEKKRAMLDRYASRREELARIGVDEEQFRLAGPVSPWARPHPGVLHYELRGGTTFEEFRTAAILGLRALGVGEGEATPAPARPW